MSVESGEIQGLHLKDVGGTTSIPMDMGMCTRIMGVIRYHNELPKDERGVAPATIRTLLSKFVPQCSGPFKEYVCAFGAHGLDVLKRYLMRECARDFDSQEELEAHIEELVTSEYKGIASALWGADLSKL